MPLASFLLLMTQSVVPEKSLATETFEFTVVVVVVDAVLKNVEPKPVIEAVAFAKEPSTELTAVYHWAVVTVPPLPMLMLTLFPVVVAETPDAAG